MGLGHVRGDGPVARVLGVLVVAEDPNALPVGGLTQRRLQQLIQGVTPELGVTAQLERSREMVRRRAGREISPAEERELRAVMGRWGRREEGSRGFGADFYARIAMDAIVESSGRRDVTEALLRKYEKADPRPRTKRRGRVSYAMVRNWISTARHRHKFLPPTGGKGRGVFSETEQLASHVSAKRGGEEGGRVAQPAPTRRRRGSNGPSPSVPWSVLAANEVVPEREETQG